MQRNRTKKENAFKETISNLAGDGNTKLDAFDRWNNTGIAIDNLNRKLFFVAKKQSTGVQKVIDLSEIQRSSLIKSHHDNRNGDSSAIKKVELHLIPKDKSRPNIQLDFYDSDHDSLTIREELHLAEKWSNIVESAISKTKAAR
jgi:hypothetical protein